MKIEYKRTRVIVMTESEDKKEIKCCMKTDKLNCSQAYRKKELLRHFVRLAGRIKRPEEERTGRRWCKIWSFVNKTLKNLIANIKRLS